MTGKPLVVAIMLVNGREAMARRAVASFRSQSYESKWLFIYDTSEKDSGWLTPDGIWRFWTPANGRTIGALRNAAIGQDIPSRADIICHFDSDDVSHPQRIAEQVALLAASGADCVGYYEAPFWDTRSYQASRISFPDVGGVIRTEALAYPHAFAKAEAWLYRDPARKHVLGASMAYTRAAWTRHPFDDINHGEDTRFQSRCSTKAVSAMECWRPLPEISSGATQHEDCEPRIVCSIHGSNTSPGYDFTKRQQCFKRAVELDEYCAQVMAL